jgi:hypothetical protein
VSSRVPPGLRIAATLGEAVKLGWLSDNLFGGVEKFGQVLNYPSASGLVTVWSGASGSYNATKLLPESGFIPVDPATTDTTGLTPARVLYVTTPQVTFDGVITIQGLGLGGVFQTAVVTANGQSAEEIFDAAGGTLYWTRVFRAWINHLGSGTALTNPLYITNDSTPLSGVPGIDETCAMIENSASLQPNQTLMAFYTVPTGWSALINGYTFSINKQSSPQVREANFYLETRLRDIPSNNPIFRTRHISGASSEGASTFSYEFPVGISVPELTDIRMSVVADTDGLDFTATFSLYLKK